MNAHSEQFLKDVQIFFKMNVDEFDITVVGSDNKELKANSTILKARSEVFRTMLTRNMKEANNKKIIMSEFDSSTISPLLDYIHFTTLPSSPSNVATLQALFELCYLARLYQVEQLLSHITQLIIQYSSQFAQAVEVWWVIRKSHYAGNNNNFLNTCQNTITRSITSKTAKGNITTVLNDATRCY